MKATRVQVKKDGNVLYMGQFVQASYGVAHIQVAVNLDRVRETLVRLYGADALAGADDRQVARLANRLALRGALQLAGTAGKAPAMAVAASLGHKRRRRAPLFTKEELEQMQAEAEAEVDAEEATDVPVVPDPPSADTPDGTNPPDNDPVEQAAHNEDIGPGNPAPQ